MSCSILYTWITSALSRLYSNEGNPNARSLSLYGKCDIHLTSFVARLCTFSKAILSSLKTGDHTDDAYSKCVRTKDLNKFKKMSLSRYSEVSIIEKLPLEKNHTYLIGMGIAKKSVSRYIAIRDERIAIRITIFYQFYLREFFKCFHVKEVHNE